jgi:hypothetical protein
MDKYIKDGKVAVLYSPGYGAGWYTWNQDHPEIVFDKDIVAAVLEGDKNKAEKITKEKYPGVYTGGADDLEISWLHPGTEFEIEEYDGNESIHIIGSRRYLVA